MVDKAYLLSGEEIRDFIVNGYIQIQTDFPTNLHGDIYQQIEEMLAKEGNPGNNLLPRIPDIQRVFEHPKVCGALSSLLGPDYLMHPHRYCHLNTPGGDGQTWHKDDYIFDQKVRHHRFRWVMAFYYPQDVTEDMGPTGILPRRQYYNTLSDTNPTQSIEREQALCGKAGTVTIVNFDSWHRATANRSDKKRYMLKFQFTRMSEPSQPLLSNGHTNWGPLDGDEHPALSRHVWDWLSQSGDRSGQGASDTNGSVSKLTAALQDTDESVRLNAAYALGGMGESVVPELMQSLRAEAEALAEKNVAHTAANPQGGNPADLYSSQALTEVGQSSVPTLISALGDASWPTRAAAADTLGNLGSLAEEAVPGLIQGLRDENSWVRRNAAEALGTVAAPPDEIVPALMGGSNDSEMLVRLNAVMALAKIGQSADGIVPTLAGRLNDEDRYVRFYSATVLRQIGTPEAQNALWDDLLTSRWCPITTAENPY